jgi:hypothetical protein
VDFSPCRDKTPQAEASATGGVRHASKAFDTWSSDFSPRAAHALRSRTGREASTRETNRFECRQCKGTSGIARRGRRHSAKNYRPTAEERPFSPRRRFARRARHQPKKARRDAALRHRFRAASARASRAEKRSSLQKVASPWAKIASNNPVMSKISARSVSRAKRRY